MSSCKIALVDDHILFTESLAGLINTLTGYDVMLTAESGLDLRRQLAVVSRLPDMILLDVSMPDMDGYATAAWLHERYPLISVMALSTHHNENVIVKMLRLGCKGYLMKDIRPSELQRALDDVMQNGYYFTEYVTGRMLHSIQQGQDNNTEKLSDREIEFLKYSTTEMTYKEIAALMHVSARTIDGYRDNLFLKLNVKSRVGLALYAIREDLVQV